MTDLLCLKALDEACRDLKEARFRYAEAALALAQARGKLEQVVDKAFEQKRFRPIEALFCEEEAALKVYEEAVAALTRIEERCCILRLALAHERMLMVIGVPRQRFH
ncbi:hypothetical protein ACFOYU_13150 [Microvirga sp. GCM10011540]|uniref:hypothetical protein n=1 Tax=Microvirga sp. GCM10011540 TaxID=3317338 RepID=UPI00361D3A00